MFNATFSVIIKHCELHFLFKKVLQLVSLYSYVMIGSISNSWEMVVERELERVRSLSDMAEWYVGLVAR